jgi:hypothetical protein
MIGNYEFEKDEEATFQYDDFRILQDCTSKVVKGVYSDGSDYDIKSKNSSNNEVRTF